MLTCDVAWDRDFGSGGASRVAVVQEVQHLAHGLAGITEETITVDPNHPLAGETLHFEVTVDSLRDATEEEIAHGHPHGPGGHHH